MGLDARVVQEAARLLDRAFLEKRRMKDCKTIAHDDVVFWAVT